MQTTGDVAGLGLSDNSQYFTVGSGNNFNAVMVALFHVLPCCRHRYSGRSLAGQ